MAIKKILRYVLIVAVISGLIFLFLLNGQMNKAPASEAYRVVSESQVYQDQEILKAMDTVVSKHDEYFPSLVMTQITYDETPELLTEEKEKAASNDKKQVIILTTSSKAYYAFSSRLQPWDYYTYKWVLSGNNGNWTVMESSRCS